MERISYAVDKMASENTTSLYYWGPVKILRFKEYIFKNANTFESIDKEIQKFEVIFDYELEHEDDTDDDYDTDEYQVE